LNDAKVNKVTFGRAAKLINVYMKAMVMLGPNSTSALSRVAHPPIDAILLSNIARSPDINLADKLGLARLRWTALDEQAYYHLINRLRPILDQDEPFWLLERHWTVTDEIG